MRKLRSFAFGVAVPMALAVPVDGTGQVVGADPLAVALAAAVDHLQPRAATSSEPSEVIVTVRAPGKTPLPSATLTEAATRASEAVSAARETASERVWTYTDAHQDDLITCRSGGRPNECTLPADQVIAVPRSFEETSPQRQVWVISVVKAAPAPWRLTMAALSVELVRERSAWAVASVTVEEIT